MNSTDSELQLFIVIAAAVLAAAGLAYTLFRRHSCPSGRKRTKSEDKFKLTGECDECPLSDNCSSYQSKEQ